MMLTVTKTRKWKVLLCNLHVDLHVRVLDMMTSLALLFPEERLRYLFKIKQVLYLRKMPYKVSPTN